MQTTIQSRKSLMDLALMSLLFLFFFQLLSDFVEAIYAFGLMGTSIPVEIVFVFFFFSPLLLILLPKGITGWPLIVVGEIMLACRLAEALLDTRGKMIFAGLGVACFLVFFPCYYLKERKASPGDPSRASNIGLGLTFALLLSMLFRTLGSGFDVSTFGWSQTIGWVLVIAAGLLLVMVKDPTVVNDHAPWDDTRPLSSGKTIVFSLGIISVLLLGYFVFSSPYVIARWTGASHLLIIAMLALMFLLSGLMAVLKPQFLTKMKPIVLIIWNGLFAAALTVTILVHQVKFPITAEGYPLMEPPVTWLHGIPVFLLILLCPVISVDLARFAHELVVGKPSIRALGAGFSVASLYFFLMVFAQVFTTVYDYIPVVGPFFRDKFWFVFLVAGIFLAVPVLFLGKRPLQEAHTGNLTGRRALSVLIAGLALTTTLSAWITAAQPVEPAASPTSLKIITYNIQQGYNKAGVKAFAQQLELFREVDADLIGLQESDTARIAGGNADIVKYFADELDMYAYYGPKTVTGTFGIALLSKYPIDQPRTAFMDSTGEQTAMIQAQIQAGGKTFNVFATHLGNGGPIVQQEAVMQVVKSQDHVILMGDFNFRPDTDQYRLTTDVLFDSWLLKWPQGNRDQGIDPDKRIDHIFISMDSDIQVAESEYWAGPQSDHPAMITTIDW